ncbi:MAG: lytic transglycosylase domain-containing protein [Rhodobacter sp.]|nr:lytic transglycosylase domain-containing protein [Rhodobacter sp.]
MKQTVLALVLAYVFGVPPAMADEPKPFPDFTFKRVGVPKPGAGKRITVQIQPQAPKPKPPADEPESETVAVGAFDWFWQAVSPDLTAGSPSRLAVAVRELDKGPGVAAPRLQALQAIAQAHGRDILMATIGTKVSPALVLAVIGIESSGRSDAVSPKGATGLMQLMPATAERFGVADIADPADNIRGGVAYLDWLIDRFDSDPLLVLAGYNAGENAVRNHSGVPPYKETRAYVPKVLAAWTVARGLCLTPPELITDACAFALVGAAPDG